MRSAMTRVAVAVIMALPLASCGGDGAANQSRPPPAVPASSTVSPPSVPSPSATDPPQAVDPVEVMARNMPRAKAACAGCGGTLSITGAELTKAIDSLAAEHAKQPGTPLSRKNAELALYGPAGTRVKVAGDNVAGYDVLFHDASGKLVLGRQVKTFEGNPNNFKTRLSQAAKSMANNGEFFVQVPAGTTPQAVKAMMDGFWRQRSDEQLAKYKDMWVAFHDPKGKPLGIWMPGGRDMGAYG